MIFLRKNFIGYLRLCDLITLLSASMACVGIILAFNQHYTLSVLMLILCGTCDMFDGKVARMKKYDEMKKAYGVQLDSLSDVISFGLFPAILTYLLSPNIFTLIISILYLICGITRLAYFNTLSVTKKNKKNIFIGVPITTISIIYPILFIILRFLKFELIKIIMPTLLVLLGISFILRIEIPKIEFLRIIKKTFNKYTINLFIFPAFLIIIADLYYRIFNFDGNELYNTLLSILLNFPAFIYTYLIFFLINLIITVIFKKSKYTKLILLIISILLLIINDIKFVIMDIPIKISDVNYLNSDNLSMMGTATTTIGSWITYTIIKTIILIVFTILIFKMDKYHELKIDIKGAKKLIIILILIVIFPFIISNKNKEFIIQKIFKTSHYEMSQITSITELYEENGFFQGIILEYYSSIISKPNGYTKNKSNKIISNIEKRNNPKWDKANVVFLLSESFMDINNIKEIAFNEKIMRNINGYQDDNDKLVLDLVVPTHGGGSVNTEFEILTGASLSFWPSGMIAYTQYYNDFNGPKAPNIIKEFNNNGYTTMYLTPWGKTSFKSEYIYSLFGADEKKYGDSLNGEIKGNYYSDKSLMEDIFKELKETSVGNYKFIMAASGQNHFPYANDKYNEYDVEVKESSFSEDGTQMLRSYAQGLYDADKELNNLYNRIQELDVPTIIVFYGDHLPYIVDSEGNILLLTSNYISTANTQLNELHKYTTKAVILSNYDIMFENIEYMNASYLGAYILNNMDLEISDYFKYIDSMRNILPVFNRNSVLINNKLYDINSINEEIKTALKNYEYVQYRSFYDIN